MKLCMGINCACKHSHCCDAPCVADRVKDTFVCQLCRKEWDGQACTAGDVKIFTPKDYPEIFKKVDEISNNHECKIGKCHEVSYTTQDEADMHKRITKEVIGKVQKLIVDEMLICRHENTPTSRLISLYNKINDL